MAMVNPYEAPSAFAANPIRMNIIFPIDANARIPITSIGVQEYSVLKWNEVLSSQSIEGIKNSKNAIDRAVTPEPGLSENIHLRLSNSSLDIEKNRVYHISK